MSPYGCVMWYVAEDVCRIICCSVDYTSLDVEEDDRHRYIFLCFMHSSVCLHKGLSAVTVLTSYRMLHQKTSLRGYQKTLSHPIWISSQPLNQLTVCATTLHLTLAEKAIFSGLVYWISWRYNLYSSQNVQYLEKPKPKKQQGYMHSFVPRRPSRTCFTTWKMTQMSGTL